MGAHAGSFTIHESYRRSQPLDFKYSLFMDFLDRRNDLNGMFHRYICVACPAQHVDSSHTVPSNRAKNPKSEGFHSQDHLTCPIICFHTRQAAFLSIHGQVLCVPPGEHDVNFNSSKSRKIILIRLDRRKMRYPYRVVHPN